MEAFANTKDRTTYVNALVQLVSTVRQVNIYFIMNTTALQTRRNSLMFRLRHSTDVAVMCSYTYKQISKSIQYNNIV